MLANVIWNTPLKSSVWGFASHRGGSADLLVDAAERRSHCSGLKIEIHESALRRDADLQVSIAPIRRY